MWEDRWKVASHAISFKNDILVTQQDIFDFLKPGKHWDNFFDTREPMIQTNGRSDSSFDSSTNKENM